MSAFRVPATVLAVAVLAALAAAPASGQAASGTAEAPRAVAIPSEVLPPPPDAAAGAQPYTDDEFPAWLRGLGRFETLAVGAFPVMLFYANLGFDAWLYVDNGFDLAYAPWPFKPEGGYVPTVEDRNRRLWTAFGLALGAAAADFAIRAIRDR